MNSAQWLELWDEFGFDQRRATEKYHAISSIQLRLALKAYDEHAGNPDDTIEESIGEYLMIVTDSNDEELGYDIHPGVTINE